MSSNRVILSRHVTFDKHSFPFANMGSAPSCTDLDFLFDIDSSPLPIGLRTPAGTHQSGPTARTSSQAWVAASGAGLPLHHPDLVLGVATSPAAVPSMSRSSIVSPPCPTAHQSSPAAPVAF